ncbi:tyrosine-type recombinase/integrase [Actinopolymorpha sp. B17G11]|uniref:tyrosine-type recombinase/integrase n=1 Tax=Actinopolymorpha sp. B17G11 TaxID=3160861 RepID=UPI0032E4DB6C
MGEIQPSGPRLVAIFGAMYFAGLRPEEAVELRESNLDIPAEGWGEIHLDNAAPDSGSAWTDSGRSREQRQLKHRGIGDGRTAPCPPQLTSLFQRHLERFRLDHEGTLFRCVRNGGPPDSSTYERTWRKARQAVLTEAQVRSRLGRRPYDLRHAAVSTWLNAGVGAAQVAEWAGHSLKVLLEIYAHCIDGGEHAARVRIDAALSVARDA